MQPLVSGVQVAKLIVRPPRPPADALIKDINHDKVVALNSVASDRLAYARFQADAFFSKPTDLEPLPAGHDPSRPREKPASVSV